MLAAQTPWLPQYKKAVQAARRRLKSGNLLPTLRNNKGAFRLTAKTVSEMKADAAAATRNAAASEKGKK
jgi:alpha-galactosidase